MNHIVQPERREVLNAICFGLFPISLCRGALNNHQLPTPIFKLLFPIFWHVFINSVILFHPEEKWTGSGDSRSRLSIGTWVSSGWKLWGRHSGNWDVRVKAFGRYHKDEDAGSDGTVLIRAKLIMKNMPPNIMRGRLKILVSIFAVKRLVEAEHLVLVNGLFQHMCGQHWRLK